jgi:hypothetical protein
MVAAVGLEPGLHIGYRRLKGAPGSWVRRRYVGDRDYETQSFSIADGLSDANGVNVLNFRQAQSEARAWRDHKAAGRGPFTVADAIKLHVEVLAAKGRNTADTEFRARAMILPTLGAELVADLTTERLRAWLMNLAELPPRARTGMGAAQRYRAMSVDHDEAVRRRRNTANRILAILRAALTTAWREGKVPSDHVAAGQTVRECHLRARALFDDRRMHSAHQWLRPQFPPAGARRLGERLPLQRAGPAKSARLQSGQRHACDLALENRQGPPRRAHE